MYKQINRGLCILTILSCVLVSNSWGTELNRKTLNLKVGGTEIIESLDAVKRASVINPEISDVVIISPKEFYVYGKKPGYTTIILWEDGKEKRLLDVIVSLDLTALKEKLHDLFPDEDIRVHGSETGVVLSGTVSGPDVMESVLRLTRTYLPKLAEDKAAGPGTGVSGNGITNLLRIGGLQQVLLEVKFAEVTRKSNKDWQAAFGVGGIDNDFLGAFGTSNVFTPVTDAFVTGTFPQAGQQSGIFDGALDAVIGDPGSLLVNFAGNPANIFVKLNDFTAALNLLETEGLARILAEPRLVTQSGKEASFLAGGEYPVPVAQDLGEISVDFKEFGVALRFTPIILSDGKISLRVAPSVSQISSVGSLPAGIVGAAYVVPTFATRKLDTTVELYDGQTLALAGLLQDDLREQVKKIPGLGDIPILGQLFRSTSYQQEKTDLLISVTPHLVKPVKEGELKHPGENMEAPNAWEFYLEGRFEGEREEGNKSSLSQHGIMTQNEFISLSATENQGGLEGRFGHQPVQSTQKEAQQ